MATPTYQDVLDLDAGDPLAPLRERFSLPEGVIYLDGNSLGALPGATPRHLAEVVEAQWGRDLIRSWNAHDWIGLPRRIGERIAKLIGAGPDEVIACDSTSVNLFKLLQGALALSPSHGTILTEDSGFPTDRYMAQSVANLASGTSVKAAPRDAIIDHIDDDTALVLLTHVDYRSGHKIDMAAMNKAAHDKGALVLWDLSHSTGAVALDLAGSGANLAVGCGYKYLNGGPGAPAFLYVRSGLQERLETPLPGWMGHAEPFAFSQGYAPSPSIDRFLCGTPPILAMAALESGLAQFDGVDLAALFAKGQAICGLYIELMQDLCERHGFTLASPADARHRGSHVSFAHPHAHAVCQALIERGVIGDFRTPDILRMGFTPLYTRFADVWEAVRILREVMDSSAWQDDRFTRPRRVT
ncbi:kynureninase [Croceicoccus sediminis]|uniref:kynureninase n=1 Tax=Croceicoccus sediminis TaxID=2571150 RepID=UPI0011821B44|nr:kynureninase [Croceicoccus sediminis]